MSRPAVVFGDVHGDSVKLEKLIAEVRRRFGSEVDIYSLGDLVDRGPDSKGVLDICIRESIQGILGNHELWLCEVAAGGKLHDGIYAGIMGGLATLRSYGLERGDPDHVGPALFRAMGAAHREYLLNLPPYRRIEVGGRAFWLIHCGLSSDTAAGILQAAQAAQGRRLTDEQLVMVAHKAVSDVFFWMSPKIAERKLHQFSDGATQILGHVPLTRPEMWPGHFLAIDTGCGTRPPYALSAVIISPNGLGVEALTIR